MDAPDTDYCDWCGTKFKDSDKIHKGLHQHCYDQNMSIIKTDLNFAIEEDEDETLC